MGPFFGGCAFLLKNTRAELVCIPLGTCLDFRVLLDTLAVEPRQLMVVPAGRRYPFFYGRLS
jgi:hypothetical protein